MERVTVQRGEVVICVLSGDFGKPRPAVVVQSDLFNPTHASITVCPLTSHLIEASLFRVPVQANSDTGLQTDSQVMVDKIMSIKVDKIREVIGTLPAETLEQIDEALQRWLGIP